MFDRLKTEMRVKINITRPEHVRGVTPVGPCFLEYGIVYAMYTSRYYLKRPWFS